jgi:hypothetical protein
MRDIRGMALVGESFPDAKAQVAAEVTCEPRMLLKTISWIYRSQPKVRHLSQLSHGLTGRDRTMSSMPDTRQGTDLRIRIEAH